MAKKQSQPSSLIVALALPALILTAYASYTRLYPSETAQQIARLEQDFEKVKSAQIAPAQATEVLKQLSEMRKQVTAAKSKLDGLRQRAAQMMRGEVDGNQQLKVGQEINRVLTVAGLRLVDEHPLDDGSSNTSGMLETLAGATDELGKTLTELSSDEADDAPIELPENLPLDINPVEWMATQRALRVGKFDGPETCWSELKLVGDYRSMVAGLEAVVDTCPGVVVSSIAFQKPAVRTGGPLPLIWNVRLQMRPVPESLPNLEMPAPDDTSDVVAQNPKAGRRVAGETYTVAKPVVRSAD